MHVYQNDQNLVAVEPIIACCLYICTVTFLTLGAGISIFFGLLSLCSVYLLCDKMKLHLRKYLTRQLTGLHSQPALDFKK